MNLNFYRSYSRRNNKVSEPIFVNGDKFVFTVKLGRDEKFRVEQESWKQNYRSRKNKYGYRLEPLEILGSFSDPFEAIEATKIYAVGLCQKKES